MTGATGTPMGPSGVDNLMAALTSALGSFGPADGLQGPVQNGVDNAWADFLNGGTPPSATNWDAYTHEELYAMLWQNADVGDVGAVAAEWGRHGAALAEQADALQEQRTALESSWHGAAAEQAMTLLGELKERIAAIGVRAEQVQQATDAAGDALAFARATMPPPTAPAPAGFALPPAPAPIGLPSAPAPFALSAPRGIPPAVPQNPMEIPTPGGSGMGLAFGSLAAGQSSMFDNNAMSMGAKAEAVRVMRRYESGLSDSDGRIRPAGATGFRSYQADGADIGTTTSAAAVMAGEPPSSGGTTGPLSGRVSTGESWRRLVGNSPLGTGMVTDPVPPGRMVGAGPGQVAALGARAAMAEAAAATRAAAGTNGFMPAAARPEGAEDEERRSTLPTVDQQLFTVEERACAPVIGL
ncbi:hypothetical protein ALI144C_41055 [Actinosynnema sp. ALI-1.44]|nr:hypothetical protein ALI144C_41055 [Actinosynnema sp. ALI-1.44]